MPATGRGYEDGNQDESERTRFISGNNREALPWGSEMTNNSGAGLRVLNLSGKTSIDVRADNSLNCNVGPGEDKTVPPVNGRNRPRIIRLEALDLDPPSKQDLKTIPVAVDFNHSYEVQIKFHTKKGEESEWGAARVWELEFLSPPIHLAGGTAVTEIPLCITIGPEQAQQRGRSQFPRIARLAGTCALAAAAAWAAAGPVKQWAPGLGDGAPVWLAAAGIILLSAASAWKTVTRWLK